MNDLLCVTRSASLKTPHLNTYPPSFSHAHILSLSHTHTHTRRHTQTHKHIPKPIHTLSTSFPSIKLHHTSALFHWLFWTSKIRKFTDAIHHVICRTQIIVIFRVSCGATPYYANILFLNLSLKYFHRQRNCTSSSRDRMLVPSLRCLQVNTQFVSVFVCVFQCFVRKVKTFSPPAATCQRHTVCFMLML